MQFKLTLVVKTLPDASQEDCNPWGEKFEADKRFVCYNDAQWKIQTHNETVLRKVCSHHLANGIESGYEEICSQFPISPFAVQLRPSPNVQGREIVPAHTGEVASKTSA